MIAAPVLELARFRVPDDAVEALVAERPAMVAALAARFEGCLAAYLTREDDGGMLDVLVWASREQAEEAARLVDTVPECRAWFRHVVASGGVRHATILHAAPASPPSAAEG